MLHSETLSFLRCPQDRSPLRPADPELLARLNAAIAAGQLKNRTGQPVVDAFDGALVREAGDLAYPIIDQIPVLLADEAIALDELP